mmetsp:Transcript_18065/g.50200  ORF Transcript_18065/g.50200 Transcript_18065/m.50200 type:complete len:120 (-) Transcript_18065:282-641(-)
MVSLSLSPSRRPPSSQDKTGGRVALPDLKKTVEQDSVGRKLVCLSVCLSLNRNHPAADNRTWMFLFRNIVGLSSIEPASASYCPTIIPSSYMTMSRFRDALFSSLGSVLVPHGKPTLPS